MVDCWTPTDNFETACALLLWVDTHGGAIEGDGYISQPDWKFAMDHKYHYAGSPLTLTSAEFNIISAVYEKQINSICAGCYKIIVGITFVTKDKTGAKLTGVDVFIDGVKRGTT